MLSCIYICSRSYLAMPYSADHKQRSRDKILDSAFNLFALKGFDAVSIDEVMLNCEMTRGAFYAHFSSKSELYTEALMFGAKVSRLMEVVRGHWQEGVEANNAVAMLFDGYLDAQHVRGERPCPLAFLVADTSLKEVDAQDIYTKSLARMRDLVIGLMRDEGMNINARMPNLVLSALTMMVGTVAVARCVTDDQMLDTILKGARQNIRDLLGV
jgi:TetR/AcrR family transcriptional repressor of nem operon